MNELTASKIKDILRSCVFRTIERTERKLAENSSPKPFHTALLTEDIVKLSSFERSFSTSFGQGPIEEISQLVAEQNGFRAERQKESMINLYKGAIDEIERICSALRDGSQRPDWQQEVKRVQAFQKGDTVVRRIISDLWIKKDDTEAFISIKTVRPNLDQTEIAKKDMLQLKAENPNFNTYLGLYYNPDGDSRDDYSHSPPSKIFNMKSDSCVLIGEDYWNFIGGEGAYIQLLEIFREIGAETKRRLLDL